MERKRRTYSLQYCLDPNNEIKSNEINIKRTPTRDV